MYLFGIIGGKYQELLSEFQARLAKFIETPGYTSFASWRAARLRGVPDNAPYRFVDGGFLELFLDMSETMQEEVCEGLGPSVEHMRNLVEEMRRLH